jgi:hypothetical protein
VAEGGHGTAGDVGISPSDCLWKRHFQRYGERRWHRRRGSRGDWRLKRYWQRRRCKCLCLCQRQLGRIIHRRNWGFCSSRYRRRRDQWRKWHWNRPGR